MAQTIRKGTEPIDALTLADLCFTPRQLEVFAGIVRGDLQVKIADRLGISESRVEVLVSEIKRKFESSTCVSAVAKAVKLGLVDPFDVE